MFSSDNFESQLKDLLLKLGLKENNRSNSENSGGGSGNGNEGEKSSSGGYKKKKGVLTPSQIMVILAILSGALEPISIIVDRNQNVQVVLSGTLREIIPVPEVVPIPPEKDPPQGDNFLDNAIKALFSKE